MYYQPENIMEQYELSVEQITKGRGTYIVKTNAGLKVLQPYGGSEERAAFLKKYLEELNQGGFVAEQITPTAGGNVLAEDDMGNHYLLKSSFPGSECSTRSREEICHATALLARYHGMAQRSAIEVPDFMQRGTSRRETYERRLKELVQVRNYVKGRRQKNEFEQKFARQYPYFFECASEALRLQEQEEREGEGQLMCHGDYNQHNVLRTRSGERIINFEHITCDVPMMDLANFVRKMMEKQQWKAELGMGMIEAYDRVRTITQDQKRQLYILLQFPEKFYKIANHYSNSHKAWLSGRDLEKLDRVIAQEEARQKFLKRSFLF